MAEDKGDLKKMANQKVDRSKMARSGKPLIDGRDDVLSGASMARSKAAAPQTHTVVSGDTLSSIAKQYGIESWKEVYNANKDVIGDDPNKIRVGMELKV